MNDSSGRIVAAIVALQLSLGIGSILAPAKTAPVRLPPIDNRRRWRV
jgi:hypothetical protein